MSSNAPALKPRAKTRAFLCKLSRDFSFRGPQLLGQVGGRDLAPDPLHFHRGLNCLVATDLAAKPHECYALNAPGAAAKAKTTVRRRARAA